MCPKLYRIQHRGRTPNVDAADGALVGCMASVGMTPDTIPKVGAETKIWRQLKQYWSSLFKLTAQDIEG